MAFPVKWFVSTMQGAPALNKEPGTVIAWLEACLVEGFNRQQLDSLAWDSTREVLVGSNSAGHGFVKYQVVEISGANEVEFNGEYRVIEAGQNSFTLAPGAENPTLSAASGQIEAKAAPIGGWEIFNVNGERSKADFRSTHPQSTGCVLRVDDSNTAAGWDSNNVAAMVESYEGVMEDGTGINPWNYDWRGVRKAYNKDDNGHTTPWYFCGDALLFYAGTAPYNQFRDTYTDLYGVDSLMWGDFISYRPGDQFNCVSAFADTSESASNVAGYLELDSGNYQLARRYYQELAGEGARQAASLKGSSVTDYFGYRGFSYPNAANNGAFFHAPIMLSESYGGDYCARGKMPGLIQPLMSDAPWGMFKILEDVDGFDDRLLFAHLASYHNNNIRSEDRRSYIVLDIDGPWR